ncbi:MAG: radical SAM protein [Deltaproteobacteria bacterium]|nr:radical SAM protein [Deltaproteobacteria bacterium]
MRRRLFRPRVRLLRLPIHYRQKRVIKVCDEIINRKQKVYFAIRSRVDLVNPEMLKALKEAGCKRIYYGIESGDEDILKTLKKKTTIRTIIDSIKETRKQGIDTFGYFMVGNPGDTPQTINDTINLAVDLDLNYAQFSKVTPMPGTALYDMLIEETGRDYWREAILNPGDDVYIPRPACNMTEDEVQEAARRAYIKFYFRPRYVLSALKRIKSFHELARSAYTAFSMWWTRGGVFEKSWANRVQY